MNSGKLPSGFVGRAGAVLAASACALAVTTHAHADGANTHCGDVASFNAEMESKRLFVREATVSLLVSDVDINAFAQPKGVVAALGDSRCDIGVSDASFKIYDENGTGDHPPGSVKQEYNARCNELGIGGEGWATSSAKIFLDPAQTYRVTTWVNEETFGWTVELGCVWQVGQCGGEALACDGRAEGECRLGCEWLAHGCVGGSQDCSVLTGENVCVNMACEWSDSIGCHDGHFDCEEIHNENSCRNKTSQACQFNDAPSACIGTPTACEQRTEPQCRDSLTLERRVERANDDGLLVDRVTLLEAFEGNYPLTGASFAHDEVCYGEPAAASHIATFEPTEAATVTASHPEGPLPDDQLLLVEGGQAETFLTFDVSGIEGRIERAWLFLWTRSPDEGAAGAAVEVHLLEDDAWTADSLTWPGRPRASGDPVARIDPVAAPDRSVSFDVTAAIAGDGIYAFALTQPEAVVDDVRFHAPNSRHYRWYPPALLVEYVLFDHDGDGYNDGPDCDDTDPAVFPGAEELCGNAVDDDCDGQIDEGCDGASTDPWGERPPGAAAASADEPPSAGCACALVGGTAPSGGPPHGLGWLLAPLLLGLRMRRKRGGRHGVR